MNIQIQKEEIEGASGFDLRPLARAIEFILSGLTVAEVAARIEVEAARQSRLKAARRRARLDQNRLAEEAAKETVSATSDQSDDLAKADALDAKANAMVQATLGQDEDGKVVRLRRLTAGERKAVIASRAEAMGLRSNVSKAQERSGRLSYVERALGEAVALDALRVGSEPASLIERKRGQKGVRLRSRDGLKSLHESGALRPRDADGLLKADRAALVEADRRLAIGLRYRDWYEMAQSSMTSCLDVKDRVAVKRDFYREALMAKRRAALNRRVVRCEGVVSMALGEDGLTALRMIAGEARTVNSISTGARHRERLTVALAAALGMISGLIEKDH